MQFQGSKFDKIIKFSPFIKTFLNETALFTCGVMWRWLVRFGATAMICSKVPAVLPITALHHHRRHQHNVKGIIITIMKIALTSQTCPKMGPKNHTWQNTEEHLQVKNLNFFLTFWLMTTNPLLDWAQTLSFKSIIFYTLSSINFLSAFTNFSFSSAVL